jgi:hypothetical protein
LNIDKYKTNLYFEKKEGSKVFDPAGGCKGKQIREKERYLESRLSWKKL